MNTSIVLFTIFCISASAFAKDTQTTIQIIMDDSGVLINPVEADQYKMQLLSHLKQLTRKRQFSRAHIDVINTSIGRTIWSGTPSDLKRKAKHTQSLVDSVKTNPANCNNLSGSFIELASNLRALKRQGFIKAHVIVFSSLIDTPRPCNEITSITLPQTPPVQGDINQALSSFKGMQSISFYWVSPHQMRVWEDFLAPTFKWAVANHISISITDIERSKFLLSKSLNLEPRK